jgi:hypothetical protein
MKMPFLSQKKYEKEAWKLFFVSCAVATVVGSIQTGFIIWTIKNENEKTAS